jgi:hypothetical protein
VLDTLRQRAAVIDIAEAVPSYGGLNWEISAA